MTGRLPWSDNELTPAACGHLRTSRADVARLGPRGAAGLVYASTFGIPVLRLCPGRSDPSIKHGVHGATTVLPQITEWFRAERDSNLGGRTGRSWLVADLDRKNGDDGPGELLKFMAEHGVSLPPVPWAWSPTRGKHLFMRTSRELPSRSSSSRIIPGVDLLADGGHYVVLPPSARVVRPDPTEPGGTGSAYTVPYEWAPGCCPCQAPMIPEWLAEAMLTMPSLGPVGGAGGPGGGSWADAAPLAPTDELLSAGLSPGRRSYDMYRLSLRLHRQQGQADPEGTCYRVWAATAQGADPFSWPEAKRCIRSGREYAARQDATESLATAQFTAWMARSRS